LGVPLAEAMPVSGRMPVAFPGEETMKIPGGRGRMGAAIGLAIIGLNVLAAILAPWVAPHGEADLVGDVWASPSPQHWLGLDSLGRDMLSRLMFGARTSIALALATTLLAFAVGIATGFTAAIARGWVDILLSRAVDLLMAIPTLIFALVILSVLGSSVPVLIGTMAALNATRVYRLSRALAMNIAVLEYVEAARLRGETLAWIVRREILPNAMPPLVAEFGLRFCFTFLFVASLSFLGLGIQPPYADWGGMVRDNAQAITFGGIAPLVPATAIALLSIAINLVVDWYLGLHSRLRGDTR
jgi:peptide/nickel transport system permease protein